MESNRPLVSIVIPTYNEAENVAELLTRIKRSMDPLGLEYEVVMVDDSSADGTAEIALNTARELKISLRLVVRRGERGLASAVFRGMREARGDLFLVMDADLQHPPEVGAELVLRALRENLDLVIASRYARGGGVAGWSMHRRVVSRAASLAARLLIPRTRAVKDPMSGFFAVRKRVVEDLILERPRRGRGFKVLVEILVRGSYERVGEHPYVFRPRERGKSKLGLVEVLEFLLQLLELSGYRLAKFAAVGSSGILVNNVALYVFNKILRIPVYAASPAAIEISIINNFVLNDVWTFRDLRSGPWPLRLLKYHAAVGLGSLVNYVTVLAAHQILGIIEANTLGIFLGFVANYMVSSEFVWGLSWRRVFKSPSHP